MRLLGRTGRPGTRGQRRNFQFRNQKKKSTLNDFEEKNKCYSVQNQSRGGDRSRIRASFSGVTDAVAISENLWELSGTHRVVIQAR